MLLPTIKIVTTPNPTMTYIRHKLGEDRRTPVDRWPPADKDTGCDCFVCDTEITTGQRPALYAIGPDMLDEGDKADAGRWYTALALFAHQDCLRNPPVQDAQVDPHSKG